MQEYLEVLNREEVILDRAEYMLTDKYTKEWIGYIQYTDLYNRYWAPKIWINQLEINPIERHKGYGSALMELFIEDHKDKIVMLEIIEGGESDEEFLVDFYGKFGFEVYEETGAGYYMVYYPSGYTENDLKPIPEEILKTEIKDGVRTEYDFISYYIEELQEAYYDYLEEEDLEDTEEAFHEYYLTIEDSLIMDLVKWI